jgi:hypothetical protein
MAKPHPHVQHWGPILHRIVTTESPLPLRFFKWRPLDTRTCYVYARVELYVYPEEVPLPRITLYLDVAQLAWVKAQPPGTLRAIVQDYLEQYPSGVPIEEET